MRAKRAHTKNVDVTVLIQGPRQADALLLPTGKVHALSREFATKFVSMSKRNKHTRNLKSDISILLPGVPNTIQRMSSKAGASVAIHLPAHMCRDPTRVPPRESRDLPLAGVAFRGIAATTHNISSGLRLDLTLSVLPTVYWDDSSHTPRRYRSGFFGSPSKSAYCAFTISVASTCRCVLPHWNVP